MSQLVKYGFDHSVIMTIGSIQIIDSPADEGLSALFKVGMLGIGALSVASISPIIGLAFAAYAGIKIFDVFSSTAKSHSIGDQLRADVLGTAPQPPQAPAHPLEWVPMPPDPDGYVPAQIGTTTRLRAIDVQAVPSSEQDFAPSIEEVSLLKREPDRFDRFADQLIHASQSELKAFVLWLKERKGEEISLDQIKNSWAKSLTGDKDTIDQFVQIAKLQRLIKPLANNNWLVVND